MKVFKYTKLVSALIVFASTLATAQTRPSPTPAAPATADATVTTDTTTTNPTVTKTSGNNVELSGIDVDANGVPYEQTTLPTRPTTAFNGIQATVQDTPRSVSQITSAEFKTEGITYSQDLARYAPGATANFANGTASAPYIRGQQADIYQNGIREDRGGTLVPFTSNALDGVDIITGPASAIFGPSSSTSGYLNYTTKQAYFDKNRTTIDVILGDFHVGGQSNPDFIETIDNGGPIIKDKLAYRLSVQAREGTSFYGNGNNDRWNGDPQEQYNVYGDLNWIPNKDVTIDTNFQVNNFNYASTRGWNRVTQDLVNNGKYITGPATPILYEAGKGGGYFAPVFVGRSAANPSGFGTTYNQVQINGPGRSVVLTNTPYTGPKPTTAAGAAYLAGYVYDPRLTKTTSIRQDAGYNSADQDLVNQYNIQNQATFNVSDNLTVVNNLYGEYEHAQTRQLAATGDGLDDDFLLDDRTEVRFQDDYKLFGINLDYQSNSGVEQRYSQNKTYSQILTSSDAADVTDPSTLNNQGIYGTNVLGQTPTTATRGFQSAYGYLLRPNDKAGTSNSYPIPGDSGYYSYPSGSSFDFSKQVGVYSQQQLKFDDKWIFQLGARLTILSVNSENPIVGGPQYNDSETSIEPAVNSSLLFKPIPSVTTYLTYDYTQAENANDSPALSGGDGTLGSSQFHSESQLGEGGVKWEAIPNKLFTNVAGYWQQRQLAPANLGNGSFLTPTIQVRGVEAAVNYQPDQHWDVHANWTWIESNYVNYTLTSNKSLGDNVAQGTLNSNGTVSAPINQDYGGGSDPFAQLPRGNYKESLIPKNVFNLTGSYTFDNGFGTRTDFWVHDSWNYFVGSNIVIPAEYNIDLTFFYAPPKENWRASVTVTNLTNQLNFQPNGAENVNDFIDALPPLGVNARFTYNF